MKLYYRILSLVLTFAIFASCCVFAAEAEEPTLSEPTKAGSDLIVGDWLFTDTIVNRGTNGAAKIMKEYAAAGVTDVYLLCKGISIDKDILEHSAQGIETIVRMGERIGEKA